VQVQEDVGEHDHDAVAPVARAGCRKMDFQTWLLRMKSSMDMLAAHTLMKDSGWSLAAFLLELLRLVHDELAIVADGDGPSLEGRGPVLRS